MTCRCWADQIKYARHGHGWKHPEIAWNGQFLLNSTVGVISASAVYSIELKCNISYHAV